MDSETRNLYKSFLIETWKQLNETIFGEQVELKWVADEEPWAGEAFK